MWAELARRAGPPGRGLRPDRSSVAVTGQLAVGVDLVDIDRFRVLLGRRAGAASRLFTPDELAYAERFVDPAPRLAARFAAKEAAMKLLGVGIGAVSFQDLRVERAESGEPSLRVVGRAAEVARARGVSGWALSLTHGASVAAAVVVALGPTEPVAPPTEPAG